MSNKRKAKRVAPHVGAEASQTPAGPPFTIRMGYPEMDRLWKELERKSKNGSLSKDESRLFKKWLKALRFLSANPFHPGLQSHEISSLSQKYGKKIFESYLENHTPGAARMFWTYGPNRADITILALEPHPEPGEYGRVKLGSLTGLVAHDDLIEPAVPEEDWEFD